MEVHEKRRAFHTLDGLRGIAALIVVSRHVGAFQLYLPESFLAVDLFFLLSGFVVSYAYDQRLKAGGFLVEFVKVRLIRLYPLFLLGVLLGAASKLGLSRWPLAQVMSALAAAVIMLPQIPGIPVSASMLNGPIWTLFPEIVANIIYAILFRVMKTWVLVAIVTCGAMGIIISRQIYGTLDGGWTFAQLPLVLSRLAFAFFGGVLIHRLIGDRRRTRSWAAWSCLATTALLLLMKVPPPLSGLYEIAVVLIAFPILIIVGCHSETAGRSADVFRFLGVISYAVYAIHQPLSAIVNRFALGLHYNLAHHRHLNLAVFIIGLVLLTWAVDEWYDAPVRRWLGRRLRRPGEISKSIAPITNPGAP